MYPLAMPEVVNELICGPFSSLCGPEINNSAICTPHIPSLPSQWSLGVNAKRVLVPQRVSGHAVGKQYSETRAPYYLLL